MALGEEVVGGGADLRKIIDVRIFRQRLAEAGERGSAGDYGFCCGGAVEDVAGSGAVIGAAG